MAENVCNSGTDKLSGQKLLCALDLMRRLPPEKCERYLGLLIDMNPELCQELLSAVDQPLKVAIDTTVGKQFLLCDYNRDGDSFRSPWSSAYFPPLEDGVQPTDRLRQLEIEANSAFEQYREMYYEGGISSVYFWNLNHGFAGVVLIKKSGDTSKMAEGCWDSIHVVDVQEKSTGRGAHYKLTSTVMLWLKRECGQQVNLSGSWCRQMVVDAAVNEPSAHVVNIGKMVEEMENKMRSSLNEVYFGKTNDIVNALRSVESQTELDKQNQLQTEIARAIYNRQDGQLLTKARSMSKGEV